LTEDEKELGVCLVDIGGGTTDIAVFAEGTICHTAVIPIAGDQVTNDIAIALHTPSQSAEEIKLKHGCSLIDLVKSDQSFEATSIGDRPNLSVTQRELALIIGPRYEELFVIVQSELRRVGFQDRIATGIVLTGGAAKMKGVVSLAETVFKMPVRLGSPQHVHGIAQISGNPIYSTGVGLLLYGQSQQRYQMPRDNNSAWQRMRRWFQANF
jgi:cell division protein FtsA